MEAVVLFDYEKQQEDELDLMVGMTVTNVTQVDDGWCEGTFGGKTGMFPDNFVQLKSGKTPTPVATTTPIKPPAVNPTPVEPPVVTRAMATKSKSRRAKVTFSYAAENPDELTLQPGQSLDVIGEEEDGWWRGQIGERTGLFPSNFVEIIPEEATPTPASSEPTLPPLHQHHNAPPPPYHNITDGPPPQLPPNRPPVGAPVGGMGLPRFNPLDVKLKRTSHPPPPAKEREQPKKPELRKSAAIPNKPPPIPPPQESTLEKARVVFAYTSEQEDELTIQTGDVLEVINKTEQDGWWKVKLNGRVGLVPDNFVEVLPSQPSEPESTTGMKDFGVPATEPLDSSAVKDRAHRPVGSVRPPSRSNIHPEETDPASGGEAPWQKEMRKRKKKEPVKVPPQKTAAAVTTSSDQQTEKKPPLPKSGTRPPLGERPSKPRPPPVKPADAGKSTSPSTATTTRPTPPAITSPSATKPLETTSPSSSMTSPPSVAAAAMSNQSIEESKEAFEKLKQEFEEFKVQIRKDIRKEIQTLSDDLDEERKNNASLRIDIDRLKKMQV